MKVYVHSLQGKRESNEDQHSVIINLDGSDKNMNNVNFLGVFDGHGGKLVSKYLKDNLPTYFVKKFKKNIYLHRDKFSKYVNEVFDVIQNKMKTEHPRVINHCGSTACITIHYVDVEKNKNFLWVVNTGDSRVILINKDGIAMQLSKDHKPNSPEEKFRIEQMGGKISFDGVDWRIKDLSLSRAFGDIECTPYVTHLPQIYQYKISSGDKFLIKACDGLWDVISTQDAADFILELLHKKIKGNYAKLLAEHALVKGSYDNVTVIVYFFV